MCVWGGGEGSKFNIYLWSILALSAAYTPWRFPCSLLSLLSLYWMCQLSSVLVHKTCCIPQLDLHWHSKALIHQCLVQCEWMSVAMLNMDRFLCTPFYSNAAPMSVYGLESIYDSPVCIPKEDVSLSSLPTHIHMQELWPNHPYPGEG